MTNREHRRATKILLGLDHDYRDLHAYMDKYSGAKGSRHRTERHNYQFVKHVTELYGEEAGLVAGLHIACDMGVVTKADVDLWRRILKYWLS